MALDRIAEPSGPGRALVEHAGLADVEAIRLLLQGDSVIDWHQLSFCDHDEIDRFLRINEFDPDSLDELNRLEVLREEAVEYLKNNFGYRVPPEVSDGVPVRELFLMASQKGRRQTYACVVLKVMHVIHHLAGRELAFKLPMSNDQVFGLVEQKVVKVVEEIRAAGHPITEFAWSRKERDSLITKLLAKRTSIAASVYDKLRFRLITRSVEDLVPVLFELMHRLIPFNYIIPGESVNTILPFRALVDRTPSFRRYADQLQDPIDRSSDPRPGGNEFSGSAYRVINFVADLPVRVDEYVDQLGDGNSDLGNVIFVLTEFQVMDAATAQDNELGDSSHAAYKERQRERVRVRLVGGARAQRGRDLKAALEQAALPDAQGGDTPSDDTDDE
jgi:uncharacterized protein (TIGR04552 family)